MLHKADSRYRSGRHSDLLKVKTYEDAEAKVMAHMPGKGNYKKLLGALLVETTQGFQGWAELLPVLGFSSTDNRTSVDNTTYKKGKSHNTDKVRGRCNINGACPYKPARDGFVRRRLAAI